MPANTYFYSLTRSTCTGQDGSLKGLTLTPGPVKYLSPLQGQEVHQLARPVPGVLPDDAEGHRCVPGLHGHSSHHEAEVGRLHLHAAVNKLLVLLDGLRDP